ncbi:MAG: HAD-IIB family hydrolase [Myxococcota bacterium]|nr:HAD-IIB family hydrolase [Myxococcota bacterium]
MSRAVAPTRHVRMLVLDLDGTIVGDGEHISPGVRSALAEARREGLSVVIATGRRWRRTRSVIESLGGELPAVCQGGALTKDARGETLAAQTFPAEVCAGLTEIFARHGQTFIGQRDDADGGGDFVVDRALTWNPWTTRYVERNRAFASVQLELRGQGRPDILTAAAFGEAGPLYAAKRDIDAELSGQAEAVVMSGFDGAPFCLQVVRARATKWEGLAPLLQAAGVAPHEVCAVGDEVNDLSMIRGAGLGVAMGNATPPVAEAADFVTGSIEEDGVAHLVSRILEGRRGQVEADS